MVTSAEGLQHRTTMGRHGGPALARGAHTSTRQVEAGMRAGSAPTSISVIRPASPAHRAK